MIRRISVIAGVCALVACGPKSLQAKMKYAEDRGEKAGGLLDDAEKALDKDEADRAESRIADARAILNEPDVEYYPEREMLLSRLKEDTARVEQVRKVIVQKELDKEVADRRKAVEDATNQLKKAVDDLHLPGLSSSQVKAARGALDDLTGALEKGKDFESKDKAYAERAKAGRKFADESGKEIRISEKTVAFLEGPAAARKEGEAQEKSAVAEKDAHKRLDGLKAARDRFKRCAEEGKKQVLESTELKKAVIVLEESVSSPEGVLTECISREQALSKAIAQAEKVTAIVDGPGAARKQAEELIKGAEGEADPQKKVTALKDALAKYRLCITQGKQLAARSPELRKTSIELGDSLSLTPEKLIADCVQHGTTTDKAIVAAQKVVLFVSGPGAARQQAEERAKSAEGSQDPAKKVVDLKAALAKYKLCISEGKRLAARSPELRTTEIRFSDSATFTPEKFIADCTARGVALDKEIVAAAKSAKDSAKKKKK